MSGTQNHTDWSPDQSIHLALRIWHPDCWTLQVTDSVNAGLIAHSIYQIEDEIQARVTAYASNRADLEELKVATRESRLTNTVQETNEFFNPYIDHTSASNTTQELLVKYPINNSIHEEIVSQNFIPDDPIRIRDGKEYWTVVTTQSRPEIRQALDHIRNTMNAEIQIERMKSSSTVTNSDSSTRELTERQREVFKFARQKGYYSWPRDVSATDLAEELSISKATLLEHLRKTEAKLLGPNE